VLRHNFKVVVVVLKHSIWKSN